MNRRGSISTGVACAVGLLLGLGGSATASELEPAVPVCDEAVRNSSSEPTCSKTVPMRWVEPRAPTPLAPARVVEGSSQTIRATERGTRMKVATTGLQERHAYTLWFVFFNHPEFCVDMPTPELNCGLVDLANPLADGSLVYGDGLVASGDVDAFESHRPVGQAPRGEEKIAWGDGILTNPLGAEYQSIIRNHGRADAEYMPDQVQTFNGGCHLLREPNRCTDDQASGFRTELPVR